MSPSDSNIASTPGPPDEPSVSPLEALGELLTREDAAPADGLLDDDALAQFIPLLEQKFGKLTQGCTEAVWIWRSDRFELLYVSPAFERIWGISRDKLKLNPSDWMNSIHPDDRERIQQAVARIPEQDLDEEYRIIRPTGEVRWIHDRALPTRNENGEVMKLAGIAIDITERKATERQTDRQQQVLLDLAIQRIDKDTPLEVSLGHITKAAAHCIDVERVSVWMFNEDKSALVCSELYRKSTNDHSAKLELRQTDYPAYFEALLSERAIAAHDAHTDPRTSEFSEHYLRPLDIHALLDAPIRVGGELRGVVCHEQVGSSRRWSASDQAFAASAADLVSLTVAEHERQLEEQERHELESKFAQTQKMESLGILAGGIAHDFNNLLQGMLGNVELARRSLAADSPAQKRLKAVGDTARRAAELCDELLAYSGQGEVTISDVDLAATVREMVHLLETAITKTCEMRFDFQPDLPLIRADQTQVRQVIMNLITNASDAIGKEPGVIHIRACARHCESSELETTFGEEPLPGGEYVVLDIEDTGFGMDAETLRRMFEPFFTTKLTGRGLGLSSTLGIMRAHEAAMDVRSTPGEGTRFRLFFPALPAAASPTRDVATSGSMTPSGGTVLVVDDEPMVLHSAESMLRSAGYDVRLAHDGSEAMRIVREEGAQLSCVLLDLAMPEVGGETVLHELRDLCADLPVIISSGYSQRQVSSRFPDGEELRFIKKPYDLDQLLSAIEEAIGSR